MEIAVKNEDPRVKRTRKLLQQAFLELLQEKGFDAMSIQDITERATVNRATFYAHFPDKYALMDYVIREQFQQVVTSKLPPTTTRDIASLRALICATFEFMQDFDHDCKPSQTQYDLLIAQAIQQELADLTCAWLKQAPVAGQRIPTKTLASIMSWTIFGTATQWSHDEQTPSAEEMTNQVLLVLTEGIARLIPGLLI